MNADESPVPSCRKDERGDRSMDRIAYLGLGGYSLMNIAWIAWAFSGAGFGIFDTAILIGLVVPVLGIVSLIGFQCTSRKNRFSVLANVVSAIVMIAWFLCVWYIVAAASAAV